MDFEHVPIAANDPALKQPDYLAINPLGRVPACRDGELVFSESLAINLHIAKTFAPEPLYPAEAEARILQWSFFAASDLDPWIIVYRRHSVLLPEAERSPVIARLGRESLDRSLGYLDAAPAAAPFLAAAHFTIADLNVASVLQPLLAPEYPLAGFPAVRTWLHASLERPAARAARDYP